MNKITILRYILRETMGLVVMGVALFWSAGTVNWWQGWATILVMFLWIAATAMVILKYNPDLLVERLGPRKGAKSWDVAIMSLLGLIQLARYIVAGLDQRYGWSGEFNGTIQVVAISICLMGYAMVVWATASNAFFSQIVRIQKDRKQTVVENGPYKYVRHPAYSGAILYELCVGILLGSWWVLIIGLSSATLLIVRTALEDKSLRKELEGYMDYTHKTGYRLIPGIW